MTEIILSQRQVAVMGYLRRVQVTLHYKVHSYEVHKAQNVDPLLRIERFQLRCVSHMSRMSQERIGEASPVVYT